MKTWKTKLSSIEEKIIELKKEMDGKPSELGKRLQDVGVSQSQLNELVKKDTVPLQAKLEKLEIQRQFILDRRGNLFWKAIWNVAVPILVSIGTTYITINYIK